MRRFILSIIVCALVVLFAAEAVEPVPTQARPTGEAVFTPSAPAGVDQTTPLDGFSADSARAERDWETKFRALPSLANLRDYMQRLTARPHHVGSPYDRENAEWILSLFQRWGWDAHIENFDVLMPTPQERVVEMVEPTRFKATLEEPTVAIDPTSHQHAEQLPTYNAYSVDGDVTAPLVYVNYGIPADYEQLERRGVSVKGAIVIARYGGSWRGIKPKVAAEHGAVGCIIYSDPHEDGYFQGDVFPQGAWRPREGVQRGSVMDMVLYPGDPLTPGVGATKDAQRLPLAEAKTLTKIPVLPISYGDAQPLLAALQGPVAPEAWRGALPITYRLGPGPAKVHLKVKAHWDLKTLYDVIAKIPGTSSPEEWIVRGNHQDAWVNGAEDPASALVGEMEEARALGELRKQGWKPRRTIIYCVWDGEEEGLLGSTEWGEAHADELRQHAAVYLNTDASDRGYLYVGGSHTLEKFVNGVARDIEDPEKNLSLWKRHQLQLIRAGSQEERQEARTRADWRIDALGSGSDYTVFIDHLGIASLNLAFNGEDGGGIYHSIYDDFFWYTHFSDTDFQYGRALAQTVGTAVLRLADAELLPYDFTGLADTIHRYTDHLKKLLKDEQEEIRERNQEIEEGTFTATFDPKETFVPPAKEDVPPYLDFAPLENAADTLTRSATRFQKALEKAQANGAAALAGASLRQVNLTLIESERKLTSPQGLPGRPWFKHEIYAPGFYTGYDVKTLPAAREAIEQKKWKEADAALAEISRILDAESALITTAAEQLEKALP
ncbi:MAG: transferrin receptor-like dimerization domain-containing protein [Terriglobia bacterium]|jgi:N-acetylated-alpha-linked acidic dipeptidase